MKCPKACWSHVDNRGEVRFEFADCIREQCAWWDIEGEMCGARVFVEQLETLLSYLYEISNKMPPARG